MLYSGECISKDFVPSHLLHRFFFFNDTATTEIYTLSLHDALPISFALAQRHDPAVEVSHYLDLDVTRLDRKSTRLNSSHQIISYAVFCLKKKKIINDAISFRLRTTRVTLPTLRAIYRPDAPPDIEH